MRKLVNHIILFVLPLFILIIFVGCSVGNVSKDTFDIEQFQNEMKSKNYSFKIKDVDRDFLPTTRKQMLINNETLYIYLFNSKGNMENEAKYITSDGFGYRNASKGVYVDVDWSAPPHFYKKGTIIVQYIGENKKTISNLRGILGEQFAGE
jgi:hypothetical protein